MSPRTHPHVIDGLGNTYTVGDQVLYATNYGRTTHLVTATVVSVEYYGLTPADRCDHSLYRVGVSDRAWLPTWSKRRNPRDDNRPSYPNVANIIALPPRSTATEELT